MIDNRTAADSLAMPLAARLQGSADELDLDMTEYARLRHPAVRWWWGQRVVEGANGATCYLCDKQITTWARAWPVTSAAIEAVLAHRLGHVVARNFSFGYRAAGKSPTVGAPPAGEQK